MLPSALIRDVWEARGKRCSGPLATALPCPPAMKPTPRGLSLLTVLFAVNYLALIVIFKYCIKTSLVLITKVTPGSPS